MTVNFCKKTLDMGGRISPLIIETDNWMRGIMNPSVLVDGDQIIVNLRCIQYVLFHAEKGKFEHPYGPLVYLNPENDISLTTKNYLCFLNPDLSIRSSSMINTSKLDQAPKWEFVGLEDARIVKWNEDLYLIGVRRDTSTNGEGRMELSKLEIKGNEVIEKERVRLPAPGANNSYCEKNWMPILDQPYRLIKWTNPTEVVEADPVRREVKTLSLRDGAVENVGMDLRGGSQVIPWEDGYMAIIHTALLFNSEAGRKNAQYRHRFVTWSKDWTLRKISQPFSFLGAEIEFCCGLAPYKDSFLITFGFQDNAAFILQTPHKLIKDLLNE